MKYLKHFIKRHKPLLALVIFLLIGQVVGTLLVPYLVATMIDVGILHSDMNAIIIVALQMLGVALVTSLISVLGSYFCSGFGAAFGKELREALFRKTQDLSIKDFDTLGTSSLITRTTSDITNIQQTLIMVLQLIVPAPLIAVTAIGMTASVNLPLAVLLVITILLFVLILLIILKKSQALSYQIQKGMDKINGFLRESILGIKVIRAFDNSDYEKAKSNTAFEKYASTIISLNRIFAFLNPGVWLIMSLSIAAIIGIGGFNAAIGTMAIGEIASVTEYSILTLSYLIVASFSLVTLPKMRACLQRISEVLDMETSIVDVKAPKTLFEPIQTLSFEQVNFSYPGAQLPVLHDLSFSCESGKTTAIIGGTGSGKSTIAGLVQRLHDINSGHIRINHTDIRDLTQHRLRELIGYVPQKAFLFSGTIADNLRMGKKDASLEELCYAAEISQAKAFIDSLPLGFDAPVSQAGKNFSGGQKQRLAIARAIIKQAPILIFDDSFSALDFKTDSALRKTLKQEVKNSIILIIAQRISTIVDADQIIVVDDGNIIGIGNHEELLENCAVYQEIAKSQAAIKEVESL